MPGLVGVGIVVHGLVSLSLRRNGDITSNVPMYYSAHSRTAASTYPVREGCTCRACEFMASPPAELRSLRLFECMRPKMFIHVSDQPLFAQHQGDSDDGTFLTGGGAIVIKARGALSLALLVASQGAVVSFEDSRQSLAAHCAMVAIGEESRIEFRGAAPSPRRLVIASVHGGTVSIDPVCRLTCKGLTALHYLSGIVNKLYPLPAADSTTVFAYKSAYERGLGALGEKADYEWSESTRGWQGVFHGVRRTHMAPQTPAAAAAAASSAAAPAQEKRRRPRSTGQFTDDPNSDDEDEYLEQEGEEDDSEGDEDQEDEQSEESEGGYHLPPGPWQDLPPPEYHDGEEDEGILSELSPESVQEDGEEEEEEEEEPIPYIEPEPRKCKKRTWTEAENYLLTEPDGRDASAKPCTPTDCLVCQTPATVMMLPCRHVAYCVACTKSPKNATPDKCPFCRADVGTHVLAKLLPLLRPCQS